MRKVLMAVGGVCVFLLTMIFAGPASSGGLFLLGASPSVPAADHALPADYGPLHEGSIDLGTGLYIRKNEDLVVDGTPPLFLRRTYLSGYRVSRAFGIGTTHTGEESLIGDVDLQWAALVEANGARINFRRVSPGTSVLNALYVHDETATEWQGARLGWTGLNWALRKRDGSLALYQGCGGRTKYCAIIQDRDAHGHTIHYRRDGPGRLLRMESGADRWIAFEYDDAGRVIRAHDSTSREVRYTYDARGRLARATTNDGIVHRYGYTDADELATIEEPGTSIENVYRDGRVVRQVNRFPDREPYIFDFTYTVEGGRLVATGTQRSDGTWTRYTWDDRARATSETLGREGFEPAAFTYERDPATRGITALTLTCPDRQGRPLRHSSVVRDGNEEAVKQNLLQTHCFWNTWRKH